MILRMYTVYDKVSGSFSDIKLFTKEELAVRWFNNFKKESPFGLDLDLYYLGEYNLDTAEIKPVKADFVGV